MKVYIGASEALGDDEFTELALGLLLGEDDESDEERAARLDASRDLFAADPELADRADRIATGLAKQLLDEMAPGLLSVAQYAGRPRRSRKAVAA